MKNDKMIEMHYYLLLMWIEMPDKNSDEAKRLAIAIDVITKIIQKIEKV